MGVLKSEPAIKPEPAAEAPPPYSATPTTPRTPSANTNTPPLFPPSVERTIADSSISSTSTLSSKPTSSPPSDAQKCRAPLRINQTNSKISSSYLITAASSKTDPPDADLSTTNAKIEASIWADEADWGRPFELRAKSTNAKVVVDVNTVAKKQDLDITATTSNAAIHLLIPKNYHGTLTLSTTNAKTVLSPTLQQNSVRVSCPSEEKDKHAVCYEIGGSHGGSNAVARTTNARVSVGIVGEGEEAGGERGGIEGGGNGGRGCGRGCAVM